MKKDTKHSPHPPISRQGWRLLILLIAICQLFVILWINAQLLSVRAELQNAHENIGRLYEKMWRLEHPNE